MGPANPDPVGPIPGRPTIEPIPLGPVALEGPVEFWNGNGAALGGKGGPLTACSPLLALPAGLMGRLPDGIRTGPLVVRGAGCTLGMLAGGDPGVVCETTLFWP